MVFSYLKIIRIKVIINAKIVGEINTFKVIIFSHDLSFHKNSSSVICKELASRGYIVLSLDHQELIKLSCENNPKISDK
jgi:hypothetical protein